MGVADLEAWCAKYLLPECLLVEQYVLNHCLDSLQLLLQKHTAYLVAFAARANYLQFPHEISQACLFGWQPLLIPALVVIEVIHGTLPVYGRIQKTFGVPIELCAQLEVIYKHTPLVCAAEK